MAPTNGFHVLIPIPSFETKTPLDVERIDPLESNVVSVKVVFAAFFTAAGCASTTVTIPKQSNRRIENILIDLIIFYIHL
jgi:hypothetical protein